MTLKTAQLSTDLEESVVQFAVFEGEFSLLVCWRRDGTQSLGNGTCELLWVHGFEPGLDGIEPISTRCVVRGRTSSLTGRIMLEMHSQQGQNKQSFQGSRNALARAVEYSAHGSP